MPPSVWLSREGSSMTEWYIKIAALGPFNLAAMFRARLVRRPFLIQLLLIPAVLETLLILPYGRGADGVGEGSVTH
jgi:hypothetical protein